MNNKHRLLILLLDDDQGYLKLLNQYLSMTGDTGYESRMTTSYKEALELLKSGDFDVGLIDHDLKQDVTGTDVIEQALAAGVTTPLVMVTAMPDMDIEIQALSKGAVDFVSKDEMTAQILERTIKIALLKKEAYARLPPNKRNVPAAKPVMGRIRKFPIR